MKRYLLFALLVTLIACSDGNAPQNTGTSEGSSSVIEETENNTMIIQIDDHMLTATLADNSSAKALNSLLADGPLTVEMSDYGSMEKVGSLGTSLPTNDEQITTEAGDIILYQGNLLVIYYAPNSWNFTRLGKINGINAADLKEILGDGEVTVVLSLEES